MHAQRMAAPAGTHRRQNALKEPVHFMAFLHLGTVQNLGKLAEVMEPEHVSTQLLPLFTDLTQDGECSAWHSASESACTPALPPTHTCARAHTHERRTKTCTILPQDAAVLLFLVFQGRLQHL